MTSSFTETLNPLICRHENNISGEWCKHTQNLVISHTMHSGIGTNGKLIKFDLQNSKKIKVLQNMRGGGVNEGEGEGEMGDNPLKHIHKCAWYTQVCVVYTSVPL